MKTNSDYWKEAYKEFWKKSGSREENIRQLLEQQAGVKVHFAGLGAGSDQFISGSAESHGFEKGEADLWVEGTNIYLEITGPLTNNVSSKEALWIRPDKIENAIKNFPQKKVLILHCLEKKNLIRVIIMDEKFFEDYNSSKYAVVTPFIRGKKETFISIPPDDPSIKSFSLLVHSLQNLKEKIST